MDIRAIIFDKDGTLMDFDSFWIEVSVCAMEDILKKLGREDIPVRELMASLGADGAAVDIDGLLCKGTYEQIGLSIYDVLKSHGAEISPDEAVAMTVEAYNENAVHGTVKPACDNIREVLQQLKSGKRRLAVATTDNPQITLMCLEKLGIADLFDKIYTDDGKTPVKPNPQCAKDFCAEFGISPEKTVMVGDTMTDVSFAKNAGISAIGVGRERERLAPYADAVIPDISHIFDLAEEE